MYAFILATLFWLLNALSNTYSSTIALSIEYSGEDENLISQGMPRTLNVTYQELGRTIFWNNISRRFKNIEIDLGKDIELLNNQSIGLISNDLLKKKILESLSGSANIVSIEPKRIHYSFEPRMTKRVPILIDKEIASNVNPLHLPMVPSHDSVSITGFRSEVEGLTYWKTEIVTLETTEDHVSKEVNLLAPDNDRMVLQPNKIVVNIYPDQYTIDEKILKIKIINVPEGTNVQLLRSSAQVQYEIPLSRMKDVNSESMELVADFEEVNWEEDLFAPLELQKFPLLMRRIKVIPSKVQFLKQE